MAWFLALVLALQAVTATVRIVLDDDHAESAGIVGYRWTVDGERSSSEILTRPPCTACLVRVFQMGAGNHTVTVTPYTATSDLNRERVTITVSVTIEGSATEQRITIRMSPPQKTPG